jgi:two-component system, sensor histidine kinase
MPEALDLSKPLILNVNDSEASLYMVGRMLKKAGYRVVDATTGLGALELLAKERPDLVVLDIRLPDISGIEVCRRIRQHPELGSTKVLQTSATYVTAANKVESLEGGADAYLAQPFEAQELVATVHSLVRLHRAEQALREDAEQLREADRRKNEFLSMLAHELRNPLAAISAALAVVDRRPTDDLVERRARDVLGRQTQHLGRLIDDLLDVARVTRGKIDLAMQVVDLAELLERVCEGMRESKTNARRQQVSVRLLDREVRVWGDPARLEQIFVNLVDNASKYSDNGGAIEVCMEREGDGQARVVVRDGGIGIAPQTLPTIFGLFSQADVPMARSRGGLGIGLTLVRTLVELHGGHVIGKSPGLGLGSEFEVVLPTTAKTTRPAFVRPAPKGERRRVLLVEDNEDARETLAELMQIWGHEVSCAADGLDGVEKALAIAPEVVLVDIGLPGIDGYEVARRIRQGQNGHSPTLIALTGYGSPEQRDRSLEAGFDLHVVKPVETARLKELLQGHGFTAKAR